jgi:hypothetical protein
MIRVFAKDNVNCAGKYNINFNGSFIENYPLF